MAKAITKPDEGIAAKVNETMSTTENIGEADDHQAVIDHIEGQMVQIFLAPAQRGESTSEFVGLNGKGYLVPKGRPVYVPTAVYDILRRSADAKVYTEAYEAQAAAQLNDRALN